MELEETEESINKNLWISNINVWSYGPLTDISLDKFERGLVLIYGPNESGKTLLLESILKSLLILSSDFLKEDRIGDSPNSKIIINKKHGKNLEVFNFPENKKNLDNIMEITLKNQPFDRIFRNAFIIRNSDLKILEEKGYYSTISNIVMGWDYEDLETIKQNIRRIGRLTKESSSERAILTNLKGNKIKTLRKSADELSNEMIEYIKDSKEEKYEQYEIKILEAKKSMSNFKKRLEYLENVDGKSKYEKSKTFLDEYIEISRKLEPLKDFNEDSLNILNSMNNNITEFKNRREELENKNSSNINELKQVEDFKEELNKNFDILTKNKTNIDIISKNLEDWKNSSQEIKNIQDVIQYKKLTNIFIILSLITLPGSILSILLSQSILGYIFMIFGIIFGFMAIINLYKFYKLSNLQKLLIDILELSNKVGIELSIEEKNDINPLNLINSTSDATLNFWLQEIEKYLNQFSYDFGKKEKDIINCESRISVYEKQIENDQKTLDDYQNRLKSIEYDKRNLFNRLKIENDDNFHEKYKTRENLEITLEKNKSHLKEFFGPNTNTIEEWQFGLKKYEKYKDLDVETYVHLTEIHDEQDDLRRKVQDEIPKDIEVWSKYLSDHRDKLRSLANNTVISKLNEFGAAKESLEITSTNHLEVLLHRINEFKNLIDNDKELAIISLEILEEIEREEKERIIELFKTGNISTIFKKITNGRYLEVQFNKDYDKYKEDYIIIKNSKGQQLTSNLLSLGTNDQLYFSIRLALAEQLLGENTGFFLIDDAFITSDPQRLKNQFEILKFFAENGWQIIYFSNKEEIIQLFKTNQINSIFKLSILE